MIRSVLVLCVGFLIHGPRLAEPSCEILIFYFSVLSRSIIPRRAYHTRTRLSVVSEQILIAKRKRSSLALLMPGVRRAYDVEITVVPLVRFPPDDLPNPKKSKYKISLEERRQHEQVHPAECFLTLTLQC